MQISGKHIPLTVAHLTGYTSPNSNALSGLMYCLERSDVVRAYGFFSSHNDVLRMLNEGKVNTITIDLRYFTPDRVFASDFSDKSAKGAHKFISSIRAKYPPVVIALYTDDFIYERLCKYNSKYGHYFFLSDEESRQGCDTSFEKQLRETLAKCEAWFFKFFEYDVVISYAGDDHAAAARLAEALRERGTRVFFDQLEYEMSASLGQDVVKYLTRIYKSSARLCLVLVSKAYVQRRWTLFELDRVRERIKLQPATEYVVPVKLDEATLPDIPETTVYLDMKMGVKRIVNLIEQKLWILDKGEPKHRLSGWWR